MDQIHDPNTHNVYSIFSNEGKNLLKSYVKHLQAGGSNKGGGGSKHSEPKMSNMSSDTERQNNKTNVQLMAHQLRKYRGAYGAAKRIAKMVGVSTKTRPKSSDMSFITVEYASGLNYVTIPFEGSITTEDIRTYIKDEGELYLGTDLLPDGHVFKSSTTIIIVPRKYTEIIVGKHNVKKVLEQIRITSDRYNITIADHYGNRTFPKEELEIFGGIHTLTLVNYTALDTSKLANVTNLTLLNCKNIDVGPLANVPSLTIKRSNVTNVAELGNGAINTLNLSGCYLPEVVDLNALKNIETLNLQFNKLTVPNYQYNKSGDYTCFKHINALGTGTAKKIILGDDPDDLNIDINRADLGAIPNLTFIYGKFLKDATLQALQAVKELTLFECTLQNIEPLGNIQTLTIVDQSNNGELSDSIHDANISHLRNVSNLTISHNITLTDVVVLGTGSVERLVLNQCNNLTYVSGLANISDVTIRNSRISDISGLGEVKNLTLIRCYGITEGLQEVLDNVENLVISKCKDIDRKIIADVNADQIQPYPQLNFDFVEDPN
jgi:hypothetical protein